MTGRRFVARLRAWRERRLMVRGYREFAAEDLALAEEAMAAQAETLACPFCHRITADNCETGDDLRYCAYTPSTTEIGYVAFHRQWGGS